MGRQSWTQGPGPLVPFAEGFRAQLLEVGHAPVSLKHHVVLMGQLTRWLAMEGLGVEMLTGHVARGAMVITDAWQGYSGIETLNTREAD